LPPHDRGAGPLPRGVRRGRGGHGVGARRGGSPPAIQGLGAKAGVVLNPATPLTTLQEILPQADFVLLMSVNPGFGGQVLLPSVLAKARQLRAWIDREGLDTRIEIDGGVTEDNLAEVATTGVDMIVAGSAVFGSKDPKGAAQRIVRRLAELAEHD
jgi:ribulose-phosphate 3-epimerase